MPQFAHTTPDLAEGLSPPNPQPRSRHTTIFFFSQSHFIYLHQHIPKAKLTCLSIRLRLQETLHHMLHHTRDDEPTSH